MTADQGPHLLAAGDLPPAIVTNPAGGASFLLIGDHAGHAVPSALGSLGLAAAELQRHIAIDIGVSSLGRALSAVLDAPFVEQRYSRLVVDCNRWPDAVDLIAPVSDDTPIPGNVGLSAMAREQRMTEIFEPYHQAIADTIAGRSAGGQTPSLIALHSFTPVMNGFFRPWHIGVLHDEGDTRLALGLLRHLKQVPDVCVADNEPYRMDATDYTVPRHAYRAGLPYVEIEVRQDLLADDAGVAKFARILADGLLAAAATLV
ncbi:N-formylglutamate amidohydrolase [Novosphingobium lentum]|uniref:N-formylglutamate amidohydrolase n=1 Tax=Novosphingobium lentum TaxID=145287 RepID=UPI00082FDFBF|nr:N-formylglutamate amidohydrolase [Novosphingobium lentum]